MKRMILAAITRLRGYLTDAFATIYTWVRATRKRRIIVTVIASFIVLSTIFGVFVAPRMYDSFLHQHPHLFAMQQDLEKRFPDKQIGIGEQTFYNVGNDADGKQHILAIGIVGNSLLNFDEAMSVQDIVCKQLNGDTGRYDNILLQSVNEKRIWLFFYRTKHAGSLSCDPKVQAQQKAMMEQAATPPTVFTPVTTDTVSPVAPVTDPELDAYAM